MYLTNPSLLTEAGSLVIVMKISYLGLMIDEDESDKENTHSKRPRGSTFVDSDSGGSDNGSVVRNLIMSDSE